MGDFAHDSELPDELCFDLTCESHHPECAWQLADGSECDGRGINRIGGRGWCPKHTAELERQIAALEALSTHVCDRCGLVHLPASEPESAVAPA